MMQHLERAAKRLCLEHARAYTKSVKPGSMGAKNACVARLYCCNRCEKRALGIAHSACRHNAAIWLRHQREPSDY